MSNHYKLETPAETRSRCAKAGAEWYGDKVEFALANRSHRRSEVRRVFRDHGVEEHLPAEPRPDTLLKRAGREGKTPKGYICRPFVSPLPDTPEAIHVTRVDGSDESGDEFTCLARVRIAHRIDPVTGEAEPFAVAKPPEGQTEFGDLTARDRAIWIANQCNVLLHEAQNKDLGLWIRSALAGIGAVQSLGKGNNYYAPAALCGRIHELLEDLKASKMLGHHVRFPLTSLGSAHEREVIAESAQASLTAEIDAMRGELKLAAEKAGGARKRDASVKHQIERLREISNRAMLYKDVVSAKILEPLEELNEHLRQQFNVLLDGGTVSEDSWMNASAPTEDEPEPAKAEAPDAPESDEGVVAASAEDDDDPLAMFN